MLDTDIIAIHRKRRRERRCVRCGAPTPRAALCRDCRTDWRYCPRCEAVYPATEASQRSTVAGRTTAYCLPCGNAVRNRRSVSRAAYLAELRAREHPLLPQIKKLYRQGVSYRKIADTLGLNHGTLRGVIGHARRTGRWPPKLKRGRDWRWKGARHADA